MATSASTTVGQLVVENPARARVFGKLGIDYCCGGKKTLYEACAKIGLDAATVIAVLDATEQRASAPAAVDWSTASLKSLCENIVSTHHAFLKRELPRLHPLVEKIARVHGEDHPEMIEVLHVFAGLRAEMEQHMMKEERILFPMIIQREEGFAGENHCGSIGNPIAVMEHEHDSAGAALARIRELTGGYVAPESACNTYRGVLTSLSEIESDMHTHVHKENNILFPRALELEQTVCAG
jgi:regulator of cell morphogenesis and NO signaling